MLCAALIALTQGFAFAAQPLLLQAGQGERRVRLPRPGFNLRGLPTLIMKVDPQNGGSRSLVMLAEDLRPGAVIPWHRHLHEDEIVYTENGSIYAHVGNRAASLGPHATVFIPHDTWVTIKNTGTQTIRLIAIFNHPGFERYLRCTSVAAGRPAHTMTPSEVHACIRLGDAEYR
jgi:quercetin dioxygenase-like cupin family protein